MVALVVTGLVLVALPLLVAVVGGAVYLDRLAARGEQLVRDSVALAREGQALRGKLAQMERNARQYRIVGRESLVELYTERHDALVESLAALDRGALALDAEADRRQLRRAARDVLAVMQEVDADSSRLAAALERFRPMRGFAEAVTRATDTAIREELAALERASARAREFLFWQAVAAVPLTVALVGLFSWLILRPIGHLGGAIRGLGEIKPARPIAVGGPPEIRSLGEELERLRIRLERSEADKARFLRHMSHELKTPLASIREGTELIADGSLADDASAYREVVTILRDAGVELQQLIENLLVLSARDRAGAIETIDLAAVFDGALERHRLAITRQGLHIERAVDAVQFPGLRLLIQSALSNLIANAIRFSPAGATLYLRGRDHGAGIVTEVGDEGPGIPVSERPHVFEPFAQGSQQRAKAASRGTGVGLSVVRDCARAHHGHVEILDGELPGAHIRMVLYPARRAIEQEAS